MNSEQNICQCSALGYSPECPLAFYQGGKILHAIGGESELKPRVYPKLLTDETKQHGESIISGEEIRRNEIDVQSERQRIMNCEPAPLKVSRPTSRRWSPSNSSDSDGSYIEIPENNNHQVSFLSHPQNRYSQSQFRSGDSMMEKDRKILSKYEPLSMNDQTLTSYSVGGFVVDMSKTAQKISEVAPLPPSKLPIIFVDDNMNFYHHFFQGLDILLGRNVVSEIVGMTKYYDETQRQLLPLIEKMIKTGYERSDNEITVFTKKVVTSTFELDVSPSTNDKHKMLTVAANLWGFQYIECGMQMKEPDLKMWLQNCYNFYRTIWFNTFKSTGVPQFALEGVQTRYERAKQKVAVQTQLNEESIKKEPKSTEKRVKTSSPPNGTKFETAYNRKKPERRESSLGMFFSNK